jgi:probable F420-dependent oxidoreductase
MAVNPGRVGAWLGGISMMPAAAERELVAELEDLGYRALWYGEVPKAKEAFSHASLLLAASRSIVIATGIANIWLRPAMTMAAEARTVSEAYPGRFILGMGVSHPHLMESVGIDYRRPVSTMREYLDAMDAPGFIPPDPPEPVTRVLAALRRPMLELAAERTDGVHPYFVPPEHTARAREILGPGKLICTEQAVLLETDPAEARRIGRAHTSFYMGAVNYVENMRSLGFEDADCAGGGSDRLIDAIVAWGDEDAIRARIQAHFDAGADHVCLQPLTDQFGEVDLGQLRRLAPVVTGF